MSGLKSSVKGLEENIEFKLLLSCTRLGYFLTSKGERGQEVGPLP